MWIIEIKDIFDITRSVTKLNSCKRIYDCFSLRLSGECEFTQNKKIYKADENGIMYVPSNIVYSHQTNSEKIIVIHFINYGSNNNLSFGFYKSQNMNRIRALFIQMSEIWNEKKSGYQLLCTSLFYEMIYRVFGEENSKKETPLNRTLEYIYKNYRKEKISIKELAKNAYVSETYLRRMFKKYYDVTPNEFISNLKLDYSAKLLKSGLLSIKEISEESGFNDAKYYEKCFKKRYNKTPSQYMKENKA